MPAIKRKNDAPVSVSSRPTGHRISIRLSMLLSGVLLIVLIVVSFYGGVIYQRSQQTYHANNLKATKSSRRFALGMVVYVSPASITIDSERTGNAQELKINGSTLVSIDGSPSGVAQIKAGEIALIRISHNSTAAVILVNSNFTY